MYWKIPLFKIYWDESDTSAVEEVIKSGMNWATGPNVQEFESLVADYIGTKYAVSFNSGTSALYALLLAYGLGKGDEIIVPSFTFIATANAPLFVGAKPIFADIEDNTFGLDPESIKEKITPKTKAIMPVHVGGCACDIEEVKNIARDHGLLLIEDAAESIGATVGGKKVGSFGDSSMISFCGPKVVTTGEGGVIVTDSKNICEKLKLIRSHGRAETSDYFSTTEYLDYIQLGYNFRMSNILAALGASQMKKLEKIIELRRANSEYLNNKLEDIPNLITPTEPAGYRHIYQMYTIRVLGGLRDKLKQFLEKNGIMTKVYFHPIHLSSFYRKTFGYGVGLLPITERLSNEVLTLPMYPGLTRSEIDYMADKVREFAEAAR